MNDMKLVQVGLNILCVSTVVMERYVHAMEKYVGILYYMDMHDWDNDRAFSSAFRYVSCAYWICIDSYKFFGPIENVFGDLNGSLGFVFHLWCADVWLTVFHKLEHRVFRDSVIEM